MVTLKKLRSSLLIVGLFLSPLFAENAITLHAPAPEFTMYQYKDKTFSTDSIYGKKVLCLIFGSIT